MENRVCKCGGIIREVNKPYWDVLPSCHCSNPEMVYVQSKTTNTTGTESPSFK